MLDNKATNNFIDDLQVEYFLSNQVIKSVEAESEISKIEHDLLKSNNLYILNIQDNNHKFSQKKKLKELRKIAKNI